MRFLLLGLAATALAATPASAEISRQRAESIFQEAKGTCRYAFATSDMDYITRRAVALDYSGEETLLLLNFCLMYSYGLTSK